MHLLSAARPTVLAALHTHIRRPMLVIVARADHAREMTQQIRAWSPHPAAVLRLPDPDALPYERVPWGRDTIRERVSALAALIRWSQDGLEHSSRDDAPEDTPPPLVVTSSRALMQKTVPPADLQASLSMLRVGQRISLNELLADWLSIGYRVSSIVEEPGYFSRRGGILDIFPPNQPLPIRIELFGDEISSLRAFDPITQRSEERLTAFDIIPAHEALARLALDAAERIEKVDLSRCHPVAQMSFEQDLERLKQTDNFRGIEFYLPFFYAQPASLLDYLPTDGLLVIEDPSELTAVLGDLECQAIDLKEDLQGQGELPADWLRPYFTQLELIDNLRLRPHLTLGHTAWPDSLAQEAAAETELTAGQVVEMQGGGDGFRQAPVYGGQIKHLTEDVHEWRQAGRRVVLVSRQAGRLGDLLAEQDMPYLKGTAISSQDELGEAAFDPLWQEDHEVPPPGSISLVRGSLTAGWILEEDKPIRGDVHHPPACILLTDTEIFGHHKPGPRRRPKVQRAVTPEAFFSDVQPGNYVVHIEHGIGVFQGLVKLDLDGVEREYLQVDYAESDRLYVPIHQADRLSRYVGGDDHPPVLNRLGTADWNLVKRRAKRAVEEIAGELLEIYAAREVAPGYAFGPDTPWQEELEAAFPYVETEDQLRAIEHVKADMEQPKPMDRLICGDVGYGKTEVALRAAFKAAMEGKQAAVLVPTTVLAQQHYQTFVDRLQPYPVFVEMLSRFRSKKEQKEILEGMRNGSIDIVIGTHRLLQRDVEFKNLGLLIIDEEQRFGVSHKERLKKMRTEMDVLTLTATPIPRTLHMSLTGVRDMSTIDTPPAERLSIKTVVAEYDETLMRTAILREMDRGGQVYFVHNRVIGIRQMAQRLAKIVPEATISVAHGQMPERDLERVMLDFMRGKSDVLVSTSIIESGLDIPNANTIIINRADRFGLAQLYQLRGRVGRGAVRAYAYLMIPKNYELGEAARKRLEAIAEASELGAGFRIAMRDLEIRGAGELLGARQHGHIAAVGFDLYCRLLAQAVREKKGEAPELVTGDEAMAYISPLSEGVQINLPLPVYLPEAYVPDEALRLQLYRRLAGLLSEDEIAAMAQELEDRFGELPESVVNLLYQLKLKVLALESGVQAIGIDSGQIVIKAEGLEDLDRDGLQRRVGPQTRVTRRQIWLPLHPNQSLWQTELEKVLRLMRRMMHDPAG